MVVTAPLQTEDVYVEGTGGTKSASTVNGFVEMCNDEKTKSQASVEMEPDSENSDSKFDCPESHAQLNENVSTDRGDSSFPSQYLLTPESGFMVKIVSSNSESFELPVNSLELVQELHQVLMDRDDTCHRTSFSLYFDGQVLDVFSELKSVPNLVANSTIRVIEEPYTMREARFHVRHIRDVLKSISNIDAFNGLDCMSLSFLSTLTDNSPDHFFQPQQQSKSDKRRSPRHDSVDCTPPEYLMPDSEKQLPLTPLYPGVLDEKTRLECVKNLSFSGWNPPPSHRRMKGDLLYLFAETLENKTYHVTCCPRGFYVNQSSDHHFDPTPAQVNYLSHSLVDLLRELSPLFKRSFAALIRRRSEKHPFERVPTPFQTYTWMSPIFPNSIDFIRSEDGFSSRLGHEEHFPGQMRDWNEEMQSAKELPSKTLPERILKERAFFKINCDFVSAAVRGACSVVDGNITPINPGESSKMHMFIWNNIFFSLGFDVKDHYKDFGGDNAAFVAPALDLKGVIAVNKIEDNGLSTLGTVLIDYKGYRVTAQSIIPGILEKDQEQSVTYGSVDSGKTFIHNDIYAERLEKLGRQLKLQPHKIMDSEGKSHQLFTNVECKGIKGNDNRLYLLDLFRCFPPDVNFLANVEEDDDEIRIVKEELREKFGFFPISSSTTASLSTATSSSSSESAQSSQSTTVYSHKLVSLRPELLEQFIENRYLAFVKYASYHLQYLQHAQAAAAAAAQTTSASAANTSTSTPEAAQKKKTAPLATHDEGKNCPDENKTLVPTTSSNLCPPDNITGADNQTSAKSSNDTNLFSSDAKIESMRTGRGGITAAAGTRTDPKLGFIDSTTTDSTFPSSITNRSHDELISDVVNELINVRASINSNPTSARIDCGLSASTIENALNAVTDIISDRLNADAARGERGLDSSTGWTASDADMEIKQEAKDDGVTITELDGGVKDKSDVVIISSAVDDDTEATTKEAKDKKELHNAVLHAAGDASDAAANDRGSSNVLLISPAPTSSTDETTDAAQEGDAKSSAPNETEIKIVKALSQLQNSMDEPTEAEAQNYKSIVTKALQLVGSLSDDDFVIAFNADIYHPFVQPAPPEKSDDDTFIREKRLLYYAARFITSRQFNVMISDLLENNVAPPVDGLSLSQMFHSRGVNMRYLGKFLSHLNSAQDPLLIHRLSYLQTLSIVNIITRSAKRVFRQLVQDVGVSSGIDPECLASLVSHFLNSFLGSFPSPVVATSNANLVFRHLRSGGGGGKKKKRPSGRNSGANSNHHSPTSATSPHPSFNHLSTNSSGGGGSSSPPAPDLEWFNESPRSIWKKIVIEAKDHFLYDLSWDHVDSFCREHAFPKVALLREFCQATGVQLLLQDYPNLTSRHKQCFTEDDIVGMFPIFTHVHPKGSDAYHYLATGQKKIQQGLLRDGLTLIIEAYNLLNNIYGVMHADTILCLRLLARLNYILGEYPEALSYQQRAVIMSERVLGIDHATTVTEYVNMALYCFASGQVACSLRLIYHARYLSLLSHGENHPAIPLLDSNIGLIMHAAGQYDLSLKFLDKALELNKKFFGEKSMKAALSHHFLARAHSCRGDFSTARKFEKEAYNIYKEQLGEKHDRTLESFECLKHLTEQGVRLQRTLLQRKDHKLTVPPVQIQTPSLAGILETLNLLNGIVIFRLRAEDYEKMVSDMSATSSTSSTAAATSSASVVPPSPTNPDDTDTGTTNTSAAADGRSNSSAPHASASETSPTDATAAAGNEGPLLLIQLASSSPSQQRTDESSAAAPVTGPGPDDAGDAVHSNTSPSNLGKGDVLLNIGPHEIVRKLETIESRAAAAAAASTPKDHAHQIIIDSVSDSRQHKGGNGDGKSGELGIAVGGLSPGTTGTVSPGGEDEPVSR